MPRRSRRRRGRGALIAVVLLLAVLAGLGGGAVFAYESAKNQATKLESELASHLQLGASDLQAGKTSLKQANANHDIKLVVQARKDFADAKAQFMLAKQVADGSRLLHDVERLPDIGPPTLAKHDALDGVADMGAAISDGGIDLSSLAAALIAPKSGGQAGRTLLSVLDQVDTSLVKVRADMQRAATDAAGVDLSVVPPSQQATFITARATIATALAGMDEFQQFVPILKEVLGANGPRTYLIEQVNPAELRPGGGFIGTYSVLRADQGTLKLVQSGNAYDLIYPRRVVGEKGYVPPPGPFHSLIGNTSWSFIDSNFFPDFPSNAVAAEGFVQPRLGVHIDAVIAIDYYTVANLLQLTGPLSVPGYGITVSAANFISLLVQSDINGSAYHKALLSAVAGPLMQRVSTLPPERWPTLLANLNALASARHLQVYSNNPLIEDQITRFDWSGQSNPQGSPDFMSEVEANLGGTKANYFVDRRYSVVLERKGNVLHHEVTVSLTNNMPYVYKPNDYYKVYLRLFFSNDASGASTGLQANRYGNPNPPANCSQLAGWLTIPGYGNQAKAFFEYDTPWMDNRQGASQIYWQKQPGTANDAVTIKWNNGAHTYVTSSNLAQDLLITLEPHGVTVAPAQPAQATLPSLSLG